jgi:hypothetical protein
MVSPPPSCRPMPIESCHPSSPCPQPVPAFAPHPRLPETNRRSFSRHPRFTLPRPCAPPAYYSQHRGQFHFSLFAAPSGFHPHLTSTLRTLLPPLHCCSCKMSRSVVHATRAVPWQRAAGHQAVPARSHQSRADAVHPGRESTAPSTPHLQLSLGPADHAMSFASYLCYSPTTPAPTSVAPSAPHRRSSPLDVRRRGATAVVSHSPPHCLQSVHLNAGVLRGHFPRCLAPPAHWTSATSRMATAAACARKRARARAGSREPTEGLGHQGGSAC